MDRRKFLFSAVASILGFSSPAGRWLSSLLGRVQAYAAPGFQLPWTGPYRESSGKRLFPSNLSDNDWVQFAAEGFSQPACGVIHTRAHPAVNGMPLGGIGTGYLDIETNGTFGYCTLFNSGVPLRPLGRPFLALRIPGGGRTWVLTTKLLGLRNAQDILYWGHYPVADLEYVTDAPVSVGLRAWTPFVPGDVAISNTPGAVFEVHLRNGSNTAQQGNLIFNFPGLTQAEAQIAPGSLREMQPLGWWSQPRRARDMCWEWSGGEKVRYGRAIGQVEGYPEETPGEWAASVRGPARPGFFLPPVQETDFSTALAVEFDLKPEEEKTVQIVLAWYSPVWRGEGEDTYTRMYATRYPDALTVAQMLAREHGSLLKRVLAWQEAIYTEGALPVWLREALVNVLYLMNKCSYWVAAKPPTGNWCRSEDGLFGMTESPRECPQIECIPCSFYGNIPLVYFFPELALSTLRGYKAYQFPSGTAPWIFGGITGGAAAGYRETDGADMVTPSPGYQITMNGPCYVDMADRCLMRTGSNEILREFYTSIKKNTIFTMNLRAAPEGVISVPTGDVNPFSPPYGHGSELAPGMGLDWFEGNGWFGMTPHVGGVHMAQLMMVRRMAEKMGDNDFARQCQAWFDEGAKLMEEKLWVGEYYLAYLEPETGKKSDLIFSAQLDGEWMVRFHGMSGVFPPNRVETTLQTIRRACVPHTPYGVVNFAEPDGNLVPWAGYGAYGMFVPEVYMFAALLIYTGQREAGIEIARGCLYNSCLVHRYSWTQPNVIRGDTGERTYGSDYYQNMMLWALPAAFDNKDLRGLCEGGGLVDRVIQAGKLE